MFFIRFNMGCIMRKPVFAQVNIKAQISYAIVSNWKPLAMRCGCTAWFVTDLVGNRRFSHDASHLMGLI